MTQHLLAVQDVTTTLPVPGGRLRAVDGVSFRLAPGEALGIVGESGSGKSMLARTIMGLAPAAARTTGSAWLAGLDPPAGLSPSTALAPSTGLDLLAAGPARLRAALGPGIAMVFQDPATSLHPVTRIGHQLTETLRLRGGLDRRAARERAVELLRLVGIPDPLRRVRSYPHELSGGMRQRICIALAIACHPRVLVADEPTTALDVTVQRQILDLLAGLRHREGLGLVLITHDLALVAGRTDRLLVMYAGRVVEAGPTRDLIHAPRHPYTAGLLASIPRLDQPSHRRLAAIPGAPAAAVDPAPGCRFAPRCARARQRCGSEDPVLTAIRGADSRDGPARAHGLREVACFHPIDRPPAGSRPGSDQRRQEEP
ncbi:peptide/nickel transport system ATP-binding protein [Frankia sp. EI5c]|uniref:ABC transporter ATP-binding protein n=1 Tax=Frankia sp. EI5c TaxID=683316 RepID=UPI0007C32AAB|nr:ABC transporter ATP-binding protein [Frankia sp. EI5c]OAA19785.1 peptide/nickel transport system ATP-binding protein [Frankia sp. EI5c]